MHARTHLVSMRRRRLYAGRHIFVVGSCQRGMMSRGMIDRWEHVDSGRVWAATTQPARWEIHHRTVGVLEELLDGIEVVWVEDLIAATTTVAHVRQCYHRLRRQTITAAPLLALHRRLISRHSVIIGITRHLYTHTLGPLCTEASWDWQ